MARSRARDYGDKQQLIRDAAAELFAARGFASATMAGVAAACGMSKSLLYHYFESKEAILHDLLADHVHALVAASEAAIAGSDEARAQFRALVHAHMRLYAAARARHVLLLNALDDLPSRQREEVVALERRLLAIVGGLLERLRPDLMADPARRRPYVMSFYGLINWTHTWYRPDGPLAPEAFAELAADLFLDGFCRAAMPPG